MAEKLFTYTFDGLEFSVRVFEDPAESGVFKAEVIVTEGYADFNAFYWGDKKDDPGEGVSLSKKDSSLNMNGEGSQFEGAAVEWDDYQKISNPGLGTAGMDKPGVVEAGEGPMIFNLTNMSATEFANLCFFGVRATSVNGEGSIKGVAIPEEPEDPEEPSDDFPKWPQDISHVTLVFKATGDTAPGDLKGGDGPGSNGSDGYYTVKINGWTDQFPGDTGDDLDDYIDAIMDWLVAYDEFIFDDLNLCGVVIKGGNVDKGGGSNFYLYGDNNENGTDPDPLPDGIGFDLTGGQGNENPSNAIDMTYLYDDVFA